MIESIIAARLNESLASSGFASQAVESINTDIAELNDGMFVVCAQTYVFDMCEAIDDDCQYFVEVLAINDQIDNIFNYSQMSKEVVKNLEHVAYYTFKDRDYAYAFIFEQTKALNHF